jgi:hypothetical protein
VSFSANSRASWYMYKGQFSWRDYKWQGPQ